MYKPKIRDNGDGDVLSDQIQIAINLNEGRAVALGIKPVHLILQRDMSVYISKIRNFP